MSGDLTPRAQEGLVRLSAWMPFERACHLLQALIGVRVSKASARRFSLHTGTVICQEWDEQADRLQKDRQEPPEGAKQQVVSADGAMVPLVGGGWGEVKTMVIGVSASTQADEVHVQELSYCSRLADVPEFEKATLVELHRRGVEKAVAVAAVMDGAEWLQGFIDYHRADAERILDFAHAAEYVSAIGEAVRAAGFHLPRTWLEGVLHRLKHEGPERVLLHLSRLCQHCPTPDVLKKWQYLLHRHSQMQYPRYQAAGWPIGSGMVESANKVVVEARLKGTGMHWKPETVNPMLALRNAVCNDRWDETWQTAQTFQFRLEKQRREHDTQTRMEQATAQFLRLLLACQVSASHPKEEARSVSLSSSSPSAPVPKGRTEAQKRWGRRPFSRKGVRLQAEFAKK